MPSLHAQGHWHSAALHPQSIRKHVDLTVLQFQASAPFLMPQLALSMQTMQHALLTVQTLHDNVSVPAASSAAVQARLVADRYVSNARRAVYIILAGTDPITKLTTLYSWAESGMLLIASTPRAWVLKGISPTWLQTTQTIQVEALRMQRLSDDWYQQSLASDLDAQAASFTKFAIAAVLSALLIGFTRWRVHVAAHRRQDSFRSEIRRLTAVTQYAAMKLAPPLLKATSAMHQLVRLGSKVPGVDRVPAVQAALANENLADGIASIRQCLATMSDVLNTANLAMQAGSRVQGAPLYSGVDIFSMLQVLASQYRYACPAPIEVMCTGVPPLLMLDEQKTRMIVSNAVTNAAKFCAGRGTVQLRASFLAPEDMLPRLGIVHAESAAEWLPASADAIWSWQDAQLSGPAAARDGGTPAAAQHSPSTVQPSTSGSCSLLGLKPAKVLLLEVQDDGVGLPSPAFDAFRADNGTDTCCGAGVGLALSRCFAVKDMMGAIGISARPDGVRGSLFWCALPFCDTTPLAQRGEQSLVQRLNKELAMAQKITSALRMAERPLPSEAALGNSDAVQDLAEALDQTKKTMPSAVLAGLQVLDTDHMSGVALLAAGASRLSCVYIQPIGNSSVELPAARSHTATDLRGPNSSALTSAAALSMPDALIGTIAPAASPAVHPSQIAAARTHSIQAKSSADSAVGQLPWRSEEDLLGVRAWSVRPSSSQLSGAVPGGSGSTLASTVLACGFAPMSWVSALLSAVDADEQPPGQSCCSSGALAVLQWRRASAPVRDLGMIDYGSLEI